MNKPAKTGQVRETAQVARQFSNTAQNIKQLENAVSMLKP